MLADIAVAAIGLDAEVRGLRRQIGEQRLHDGRHQRDEIGRAGAQLRVGRMLLRVQRPRCPLAYRAAPLGIDAHGHQHPAHIGVDDDWIGGQIRALGAGQRAALLPLARVGDSGLIGDLADAEPLDADRDAFGVHHGEHRGEPLVRLADDPAGCVVELHLARRRRLQPHLVFNAGDRHAVMRAEAAVVPGQELGHQEQADTLHPRGGVGQARKDKVNHVVGQVVVSCRDEDLGPGHAIAAVVLRHRAGAEQAQVGAAMGLGQAHGPRPFTADHPGQVGPLQILRSVSLDRGGGAVSQAGVQAER